MSEKYTFQDMAELHKRLTKLCMERLGDDPVRAHKRALWLMQQEGVGYATNEEVDTAIQKHKAGLRKTVGVKQGQWFVYKG